MFLASLIGAIGSGVSSFFGFKKEQGKAVEGALKVLGEANASNSQREQAIAQVIAAEAGSGYWLAAVWRPLVMVIFLGLIVASFFGYVPSDIDKPLSPMLEKIFHLLEIGIMGYIPARTLEKIVSNLNVGRVLKTFIDKKLG